MQLAAPEALDFGGEPELVLKMYGRDAVPSSFPTEINDTEETVHFSRKCRVARRLIERGVRFVQIYNAVDKLGWDGHDSNTEYHNRNAEQTDQPTAALLTDLKRRGLLDETLVVWMGDFGRTPIINKDAGRDHWPQCY